MKRTKFIIIGAGSLGLELLKKLSRDFEVHCIDINPEYEELVKELRSDCTFIVGDATSRLVLEDAGVADADAVIISLSEEKVSLETARVLKENFEPKRVIAVGTTSSGIESLEALEVEVENIFTAGAVSIRNRLEHSSRAAHAIGIGKNEILEVDIHPNSRLANRALRTLSPSRWRIGIIYRGDNIIVPKKDTVLKAKDKVVILGEPATLKTVSEVMTFNFQRFPLEYGTTALVYLSGNEPESYFDEVEYVLSSLPLARTWMICSKNAQKKRDFYDSRLKQKIIKNVEIINTDLSMVKALDTSVKDLNGDQGIVIMSKDADAGSLFGLGRSANKKRMITSTMNAVRCPLLLCAGTFPYSKLAVPCIEKVNLQHSLETALEMSALLSSEVTALLVNPSKYISSDEDLLAHDLMKKSVHDAGSIHKMSINSKALDGNPVKAVVADLPQYNLLVSDTGGWKQQGWIQQMLNPDAVWHIVSQSEISTLLLPVVDELLQE